MGIGGKKEYWIIVYIAYLKACQNMYLLQSISQYVLVWYVQLSEALNLLISPKTEKLDAIGINLHYEPVDLSIIIKRILLLPL